MYLCTVVILLTRLLLKWCYCGHYVQPILVMFFFFFQAEDGIRDIGVTGVQTCALPIFGKSMATQVISLAPAARRIDIDTEVDWHETECLLKAAFPMDLRAERSAAETQFGYVERATHTNTSWEAAKFEFCAHRFLHVAEPGFGVAIVNDSTYGHDVTRDVRPDGGTTTTVRLSLLRAPRFPDPQTDQGLHRMRYALVPAADLLDATREGTRINLPERRVPGRHAVKDGDRGCHQRQGVSRVRVDEH